MMLSQRLEYLDFVEIGLDTHETGTDSIAFAASCGKQAARACRMDLTCLIRLDSTASSMRISYTHTHTHVRL